MVHHEGTARFTTSSRSPSARSWCLMLYVGVDPRPSCFVLVFGFPFLDGDGTIWAAMMRFRILLWPFVLESSTRRSTKAVMSYLSDVFRVTDKKNPR